MQRVDVLDVMRAELVRASGNLTQDDAHRLRRGLIGARGVGTKNGVGSHDRRQSGLDGSGGRDGGQDSDMAGATLGTRR